MKIKIFKGQQVYVVKVTANYTVISYDAKAMNLRVVAPESLFDSFEDYNNYKQKNKTQQWQ